MLNGNKLHKHNKVTDLENFTLLLSKPGVASSTVFMSDRITELELYKFIERV